VSDIRNENDDLTSSRDLGLAVSGVVLPAHTPGPWVWLERDHEAQYLYSAREPAGGWVLNPQADVGDYGLSVNKWVDVSQADARLIAAAPDLLAVARQCQGALAVLTEPNEIRSTSIVSAWALCVAAEQAARAAIAKATGAA
jgi:hypothetical protein